MKHTLSQKRSFTLLELVVIVGVMAVLTGLLLPAAKEAQMDAKQKLCQDNLKKISASYLKYSQENNGFLLPVMVQQGNKAYDTRGLNGADDQGRSFYYYLRKDLQISSCEKGAYGKLVMPKENFLNCPAGKPAYKRGASDVFLYQGQTSYGMPEFFLGGRIWGKKVSSIQDYKKPGTAMLLSEAFHKNYQGMLSFNQAGMNLDFTRHTETVNYSCLDGHVTVMDKKTANIHLSGKANAFSYSSIVGSPFEKHKF